VPRIRRYFNQKGEVASVARAIRNEIGFPVIVRNPFAQMGEKAAKLDTPRQLKKYLDQNLDQQLYAIEFIHNPAEKGVFRKIRAIVIGGEIFVGHVQFSQDWNVHMEWDQAFKLESSIAQFASMIIADPAKAIGKAGMQALDEIKRTISLDFYGIDFDLMADGRLVFFEANAAMHLSLSGRRVSAETREQMREAFRRLLREAQARHRRDGVIQAG
jgi:glutathione synthase/RimK-type ligase-like ATP-grasp enzyme